MTKERNRLSDMNLQSLMQIKNNKKKIDIKDLLSFYKVTGHVA